MDQQLLHALKLLISSLTGDSYCFVGDLLMVQRKHWELVTEKEWVEKGRFFIGRGPDQFIIYHKHTPWNGHLHLHSTNEKLNKRWDEIPDRVEDANKFLNNFLEEEL